MKILLSEKSWHDELFTALQNNNKIGEWIRINSKDQFTETKLNEMEIDKIFIPHWSHFIDEKIFTKYECILFHMTDLPFGRGGSPLQNLIKLGKKETKISAIRVNNGIDTGPIYLKKKLNLDGTARKIFKRASTIIYEMILEILEKKITPVPQTGKPFYFNRRTPSQSNMKGIKNILDLYDHIRMLDCGDNYPKAYIEVEDFKIEFENANLTKKTELKANVRIFKK